jgi:uncharacterized protein YcbK (DUF882 family)
MKLKIKQNMPCRAFDIVADGVRKATLRDSE